MSNTEKVITSIVVFMILFILVGTVLSGNHKTESVCDIPISQPEKDRNFQDVAQPYVDFDRCVRDCDNLSWLPRGEGSYSQNLVPSNYKSRCESDCENEWFRIRAL